MKKVITFIMILILCVCFSSCTDKKALNSEYQKGIIEAKSETVTDNELQKAAKEIGVYDEEVAEQQEKEREDKHNYWINKGKNNTTSEPEEKNTAEFVYITDKGKKYHKIGCQYLRITAIEIDKGEAIDEGYTPCSRCYPDGDE